MSRNNKKEDTREQTNYERIEAPPEKGLTAE